MPSSTPIRDGFRAVVRQPAVIWAEISWRWCFGAAFWALLLLSFSQYLRSLPVSGLDWLMWKSGIPPLMSQAIGDIIHGSGYKLLRIAAVLVPAYAALWIVAATVGRGLTLRAIVVRCGRVPFGTIARLNFLRAAATWASVLGLIGAFIIASSAYTFDERFMRHPLRASAVYIAFTAAVLVFWSVLNWLLGLAPVLAMTGENDAIETIAATVRFIVQEFGHVTRIGFAFGALRTVAFFIFSGIAFFVLGLGGLLPGGLFLAALVVVALAHFAVADFLYVARMAAYVSMENGVQESTAAERRDANPLVSRAYRDERLYEEL